MSQPLPLEAIQKTAFPQERRSKISQKTGIVLAVCKARKISIQPSPKILLDFTKRVSKFP